MKNIFLKDNLKSNGRNVFSKILRVINKSNPQSPPSFARSVCLKFPQPNLLVFTCFYQIYLPSPSLPWSVLLLQPDPFAITSLRLICVSLTSSEKSIRNHLFFNLIYSPSSSLTRSIFLTFFHHIYLPSPSLTRTVCLLSTGTLIHLTVTKLISLG